LSQHGFTDEYYERAWSRIALSTSPKEERRIKETLSLLPQDVTSILDAGCGDGRITNRLIPQYSKVVGLESSREALRNVKTEKLLGSVDSLPFPDKSFDLVLCCEVLEHLPFEVYPRARSELQRVADKYILVSVPYEQDIERMLVKCPYCGCMFVPARHVCSFNLRNTADLFSEFKVQYYNFCAPVKRYGRLLLKAARLTGFLPRHLPMEALCPQCGYSPSLDAGSEKATFGRHDSLPVRLLRPWARRLVPAKRKATWLVILYRRKEKN